MQRSGLLLVLARLGFLLLLVLAVPVTALAVLFASPFDGWRRAKAEQLLSNAIDLKTTVNGPVTVGFDWDPTISVSDIAGQEDDLPGDLQAISAKALRLKIYLLPLLAGRIELGALVVDGLKVDLEVPVSTDDDESDEDMDFSGFVNDFVRSPFGADILLREAELNYVNQETGFTIDYDFDSIQASPSADGGVLVAGTGKINGEPWKLDGKVDPPGENAERRRFALSATQAGLTSALAGTYTLGDPADTIDATLTARAPSLDKFLAVYDVRNDLEGSGDLSGRLTGSLDAMKATDLNVTLAFETGDKLELGGTIADVVAGTGHDLTLTGTLARPAAKGETPMFDLGVTGFSGRIEGAIDEVHVRDLHVSTTAIKTQLRDIGPITAERLYKDPEGRLGLYDLLILAGDPARPCLKITGTITDVLEFKGIELKGNIDFLTADFLDLAAEDKAALLGHITGNVAVSDADGTLGIEALTAKVTDSALISLSINLIFDDLAEANEIKFDTHLDIPRFKAFAAALGSEVEELGTVKFDGTVAGSNEHISASGTTLVGETTLTGTLTGTFAQGRPTLSGDISTALLHLSDVLKLSAINTVYQANVDDKDADVFDYSKVWETLFIDLQIKVAKIAGGGDGASNIQGRVTYLAGVIGLDPVTMTFLGGKASANGKIDTSGAENTFALKGRVDNMRIGAVLREMKVGYPVSGALQVSYDLSGAGNTKAQIPKSLNGSLSISLRNGWLGTSLLDLTGITLPAWLLERGAQGNQANLVCMVAPFSFDKGKGTTRGLVLETNAVQVVGVGVIDFRGSEVNLQFKPKALRPQFIKIAQPFAVRGPLSHPRLVLTGHPVAGAVTEVLAFPFNLLDAIIQPGANTPNRVPCRVIHTSTGVAGNGPLGLGILNGNSQILRPPRLGPSGGPLGLGILSGPRRR